MEFDYNQICQDLIKDLSGKQKEIISRRFGLKNTRPETLETIGQDFGICRERVRQIEKTGFKQIEPKLKELKPVFQYFRNWLKKTGDLRKEAILLTELSGANQKNEVQFLLKLGSDFTRQGEDKDFQAFWTINNESGNKAKKVISNFYNGLKKIGKVQSIAKLNPVGSLKKPILISYLELSKKIQKNPEGLYGLTDWPEINPKGVKDKAWLVFKKVRRPLHFSEVAQLVVGSHMPTVHNELIKDDRFVLIGRGTYALKEWGYENGYVKDILTRILKQTKKPLSKQEILNKVLSQRQVKANTVFLNLTDKKCFLRNSQGKYTIKTKLS